MTDHTAELRAAGEDYSQAREEAERIMAGPRDKLTQKARAAYAAGMKKADILRAMGHVWSRTWLDQAVKGINPNTDRPN
ncbi:hypothetical protein ABZY58_11235 [Micromonospora tulbaghiae]|uniref:hypothetical protein n=1 Tax=Micromonospora tulbaghiae TaxID=479978 RepID=UPI0033AFD780